MPRGPQEHEVLDGLVLEGDLAADQVGELVVPSSGARNRSAVASLCGEAAVAAEAVVAGRAAALLGSGLHLLAACSRTSRRARRRAAAARPRGGRRGCRPGTRCRRPSRGPATAASRGCSRPARSSTARGRCPRRGAASRRRCGAASSQLNSAVRALPTCRYPVGRGREAQARGAVVTVRGYRSPGDPDGAPAGTAARRASTRTRRAVRVLLVSDLPLRPAQARLGADPGAHGVDLLVVAGRPASTSPPSVPARRPDRRGAGVPRPVRATRTDHGRRAPATTTSTTAPTASEKATRWILEARGSAACVVDGESVDGRRLARRRRARGGRVRRRWPSWRPGLAARRGDAGGTVALGVPRAAGGPAGVDRLTPLRRPGAPAPARASTDPTSCCAATSTRRRSWTGAAGPSSAGATWLFNGGHQRGQAPAHVELDLDERPATLVVVRRAPRPRLSAGPARGHVGSGRAESRAGV